MLVAILEQVYETRKPRSTARTQAVHPPASRGSRTICASDWTEYLMTESWTEKLFNQTYVNAVTLQHSQGITSHQCDLVQHLLNLKTSDAILDLACGHGRHALELAKRGFAVTGLDYSEAALDHARAEANTNLLTLELIKGDMRKLEFNQSFNAIYNLYNSMFYWDDITHDQILQGVYKALQPNGYFLLEVFSRDAKVLAKHLEQHWFFGRWKRIRQQLGLIKHFFRQSNLRTITSSNFDFELGIMHGTKKIGMFGKTLQTDAFSVRLYTVNELKTLLIKNGFIVEQIVSSPDGGTIQLNSPCIMIIARKGQHE